MLRSATESNAVGKAQRNLKRDKLRFLSVSRSAIIIGRDHSSRDGNQKNKLQVNNILHIQIRTLHSHKLNKRLLINKCEIFITTNSE